MATYSYSINDDFPYGIVATDSLTREVYDAIPEPLSRIDTSGDTCSIVFTSTLSETQENTLDILVSGHRGLPLEEYITAVDLTLPKNPDTGELLTSSTLPYIPDAGRWLGETLVHGNPNTTTITDVKIDCNLKILGAHFWTSTGATNYTSTADFQVVDKDDILGLFDDYGLEPGDILELAKYVNKYPIPPGLISVKFESSSYASVVSGLYLRCTVDNNSILDHIYIGITYIVYEE